MNMPMVVSSEFPKIVGCKEVSIVSNGFDAGNIDVWNNKPVHTGYTYPAFIQFDAIYLLVTTKITSVQPEYLPSAHIYCSYGLPILGISEDRQVYC